MITKSWCKPTISILRNNIVPKNPEKIHHDINDIYNRKRNTTKISSCMQSSLVLRTIYHIFVAFHGLIAQRTFWLGPVAWVAWSLVRGSQNTGYFNKERIKLKLLNTQCLYFSVLFNITWICGWYINKRHTFTSFLFFYCLTALLFFQHGVHWWRCKVCQFFNGLFQFLFFSLMALSVVWNISST